MLNLGNSYPWTFLHEISQKRKVSFPFCVLFFVFEGGMVLAKNGHSV